MYYCLVETNECYGEKVVTSIVMCSKSKEELEKIKSLLNKRFEYNDFEIIEL
jgi:hypothetical protein